MRTVIVITIIMQAMVMTIPNVLEAEMNLTGTTM